MTINKERFLNWLTSVKPTLEREGFTIEFFSSEEPSLNRSYVLDAASEKVIFQLVGWASGDTEIDAINTSNGQTIAVERPSEDLKFEEKLNAYLKQLDVRV